MTDRNFTRSRPDRKTGPADLRSSLGRYRLHATWLEAVARRGPSVTISAAFAHELARALRQLVHAERAA